MSNVDPFKDIQPLFVRCRDEVSKYQKSDAERIANSIDDAERERGDLPGDTWLQRELIRRIHKV